MSGREPLASALLVFPQRTEGRRLPAGDGDMGERVVCTSLVDRAYWRAAASIRSARERFSA
ncbi:hypothetical protein [Streptomyces sp. AK02-01A]|uniref:hypothetical protein n=1 Tax=Streptomyces sp. AK02-01A TaxID=3028648 RepID=UPI0029AD7020|nr:hypothetical protein [Streptomyces sp. AK02-01A]MDX3850837.1 hypothetical protein [Streptomyces sp. AK02-01A]